MMQNSHQLFCFLLGDQEIGIDMSSVLETNTLDTFTMLPNNPPYIIGVVNLRGDIVPVISLIKLFNIKTVDKRNKVVFFKYQEYILGITVSKLEKPLVINEEQIEIYPQNIESRIREFYEGLVTLHGRKIQVLSIQKLIDYLLG